MEVGEVGRPPGTPSRKGYDRKEEFISAYLCSSPSLALFVQVAHLSHNNGCADKLVQFHLWSRLTIMYPVP